ncbi:Hypothetical protein D9617_40g013050 [Elsinoe fawcettii]|nr:Hypothetical protein D9617_40g013050 [Elsinoe fawcettii]
MPPLIIYASGGRNISDLNIKASPSPGQTAEIQKALLGLVCRVQYVGRPFLSGAPPPHLDKYAASSAFQDLKCFSVSPTSYIFVDAPQAIVAGLVSLRNSKTIILDPNKEAYFNPMIREAGVNGVKIIELFNIEDDIEFITLPKPVDALSLVWRVPRSSRAVSKSPSGALNGEPADDSGRTEKPVQASDASVAGNYYTPTEEVARLQMTVDALKEQDAWKPFNIEDDIELFNIEDDIELFNIEDDVELFNIEDDGVKIIELFNIEDDIGFVTLPKPVHALIFLFEYQGNDASQAKTDCPPHVWFANQGPYYSCASIALLNIFNNLSGVDLGSDLKRFEEETIDMMLLDPETDCPLHVWFANQVPDYSCASAALLNIFNNLSGVDLGPRASVALHIFNNLSGVDLGSNFTKFKEEAIAMTPLERGDAIDKFDVLKTVHNSFANELDILHGGYGDATETRAV